MSSSIRRAGVAALTGLVATGLTLAGPSADAATVDPVPVAKGASWIQGQLKADGLLHAAYADFGTGDPVDYADYGGTIELAYALDDLGRTAKLPAIADGLAANVDSYVTGADYGEPGDLAAGPTGKLLSFVTDLGGGADPTSFGGTDLVARMESLTTDSGRISDVDVAPNYCGPVDAPEPCDYANVFGQIWATRGLLNVSSGEAAAALDFLLSQQCSDGHFLSFFTDSCGSTAAGPDAAAFAIILLHDKATPGSPLETALADAADWLVSVQAANGSFADDKGHVNSDSTGLAAWALRLAGRPTAAKRAAVWLRALQTPGLGCDGGLVGERGAIAYDAAAYKTGRDKGIRKLTVGEWQTVAAQALPALQSAPATLEPLQVYAPRRLDAGGTATVQVLGLAPGERGCVGIGTRTKPVVGSRNGDSVAVTIAVPKATGPVTVKVQSATDSATDSATVR